MTLEELRVTPGRVEGIARPIHIFTFSSFRLPPPFFSDVASTRMGRMGSSHLLDHSLLFWLEGWYGIVRLHVDNSFLLMISVQK